MGSVIVACGLSSCCVRAQLPCSMLDLPRPGLEPVSPALADGFLTPALPGKSPLVSVLFFEESSRGGDPILQMCSLRHRNCIPSVYRSIWVWCVDHQVTNGLYHSLMQRTFTADTESVLFLPEGLGLLDPIFQNIPGEGPGMGSGRPAFQSVSALLFIG